MTEETGRKYRRGLEGEDESDGDNHDDAHDDIYPSDVWKAVIMATWRMKAARTFGD